MADLGQGEGDIKDVVDQLQVRIDALPEGLSHRRTFIETYQRITRAVGTALDEARFEDPAWVVRWDAVFANYFIAAHDADIQAKSASRTHAGTEAAQVPRPWRLAFDAPASLSVLVHLLLGINAHINYDLPQAMLAVINEADFDDPVVLARRRRDHERIDQVLASRVSAEDQQLGGARRLRDRLLTPLNRLSSRRFLAESRRCVWHNVLALQQARLLGPEAYAARVGELEVLSAAKIADLLAPGQVLLRLAVIGFGVRLPPA